MPHPQDKEREQEEALRAIFEAEAAAMGFDLTRHYCAAPEPWSQYKDIDTGNRWGGFLAGVEWAHRQARASLPAAPQEAEKHPPWCSGGCCNAEDSGTAQHADAPCDVESLKAALMDNLPLTIMQRSAIYELLAPQPADKDGARHVIRTARAVADGCIDIGEDFQVPSHLMAPLSLALDEYDAALTTATAGQKEKA